MKVIRPIHSDDLDRFEEIVFQSSIGITSLPKDRQQLARHIEESKRAFAESLQNPHHYLYLFVLEDLKTKRLIGTCGIRAKTGVNYPIHSYRVQTLKSDRPIDHIPESHRILLALQRRDGPTEVCGLFLDPHARKASLGYLLSYSRFLFMASHPHRFQENVIAEMRGVFDEDNQNPFWNFVGRTFYDVGYDEAVKTRLESPELIPGLIAQYPIYIDLLPKEVQEVIGKTHPHTEAALNLLLRIGFAPTDEVDIFDAGPKLIAPAAEVTPFKSSSVHPILATQDNLPEEPWIIANTSLDYRACVGHLKKTPGGIVLEDKTCRALNLNVGDDVRVFSLAAD